MLGVVTPNRQDAEQWQFPDPPYSSHWTRACQHDLVARIKTQGGVTRARMQCRLCGRGVGNFVSTRGVLERWDEELERRCEKEFEAACDAYRRAIADGHAVIADRRNAQWQRDYAKYLESVVWAVKRELVLKRASGICEACGQHRASQVHHVRYPQTLGLEPLWDLRAVCRRCHEIIHGIGG